MIPNFPTPYRDELVYSVLARFRWSVPFLPHSCVLRQIFKRGSIFLPIEGASNLEVMVDSIGPGWFSVEELIQRNTLLPLYGPFLSKERLSAARSAMARGGSDEAPLRIGIIRGTVLPAVHLRFCPECTAEERSKFGEAYWHRLHQVPGICVCPEHATLLEESEMKMRYLYGATVLHVAESSIPSKPARKLKRGDADNETMIRIAAEASSLLNSSFAANDLEVIRRQFFVLALRLGFASPSGAILWKRLIPAFRARYSEHLLQTMQCSLPPDAPTNRDHWIAEMLHKPRQPQAPVRYLLLMDFLGIGASEFFKFQAIVYSPFGNGPWGCINRICPSGGAVRVGAMKYEVSSGEPVGVLHCPDCGQVSCIKIVNGGERRWVREPGPIWEAELARICNASPPTVYAISRRLGAPASSVKYHAGRLGLKLPGVNSSTPIGSDANSRIGKRAIQIQINHANRKDEWLKLRAEFPLKSTTELIDAAPGCYSYLYRNERDWLKANSPASRRRPPPGIKAKPVGSLDFEISLEVRHVKEVLQRGSGPLRRVSKSILINVLSAQFRTPVKLHKLPLTAQAIAAAAETNEAFRFRKQNHREAIDSSEVRLVA